MGKYRSKVVEIEAIRFSNTKEGITAAFEFVGSAGTAVLEDEREGWYLQLRAGVGESRGAINGLRNCHSGDWIIKEEGGEFRTCNEHIFETAYEEVAPNMLQVGKAPTWVSGYLYDRPCP